MNYLRQLNAFYGLLPTADLSCQAVCLYGVLLHLNNRCFWKARFTVPNSVLMGLCRLGERGLRQARAQLVAGGWITYEKSGTTQMGVYGIPVLNAEVRADGPQRGPASEPAETGADLHAHHKQNKKQTTPLPPKGGRIPKGWKQNPALNYTQHPPGTYDDGILWL